MSYGRYQTRFDRSGRREGMTLGKSSPKRNTRACLCDDGKSYSRDCCGGLLINQGIGKISSPYPERGGFSSGYSNGFDI